MDTKSWHDNSSHDPSKKDLTKKKLGNKKLFAIKYKNNCGIFSIYRLKTLKNSSY